MPVHVIDIEVDEDLVHCEECGETNVRGYSCQCERENQRLRIAAQRERQLIMRVGVANYTERNHLHL